MFWKVVQCSLLHYIFECIIMNKIVPVDIFNSSIYTFKPATKAGELGVTSTIDTPASIALLILTLFKIAAKR